ncbi:MAG: patatin-like phospholipase family protein [Nitrospiraceae bacterium]|nr:patatin-like phospholipase family protein [Nitrospiraceae bacterium]
MAFIIYSGLLSAGASAQEKVSLQRPKIGLVLGGGGAKGVAHIGVLKVLEEQKIPIDYIAGTSMGAIVGALYASGLSAEELEKVLTTIDWNDVFSGDPDRRDIDYRRKREDYEILSRLSVGFKDGKIAMPKGLIKDQKVNVLFETLMLHTSDIEDFDKLPIPYRAVAADLETGEMVVIKGGQLADAARASMSVPGAFPPMELNGRLLIDGGIVRNLPVDIVREMGADIIICIDVDKPLPERKDLSGSLSILNQMIDIMMKKNVREQVKTLGPQDVYINPDLGVFGSVDFGKAKEISGLGEKAAREKIDSLKRYSVSDSEYAAFTAHHHREQVKEVKIASVKIEVEGETKIPPEVVASRLSVKPGDTVDVNKLKEEAGIVYGTGDFERVDLYVKEQGGYELVVKAKEKSWGPNYLRFGMALESDFEGGTSYNILLDYTRRWMNGLGAEWKTQFNLGNPTGIYSEFYQPLSVKRLLFISPHVEWKQQPYDVFDGKKRVASYLVKSYEGGIDLGIQPWMYGEARVGLRYGSFRASPRTGEVDLPEDNATRGAVVAAGRLDQLDNVNFPNKGYLAQVGVLSSLKSLGSDDEYYKVQGSVIGAYTFRKQTILVSLAAGSRIGNKELPFYDQLELGGLFKLSGLRSRQIHGQSMALGRLITYHKVGTSFIGDLYLGGSLESGNVWGENEKQFDLGNLRLAGSLFVGYDTIIGPLYLAFGHADGGFNAGYFYLGRAF